MAFSNYIIYADESGSPVLTADLTDFPVFVLVFLIVSKAHYANALVSQVQTLKFDFVGHDQIVLHERDIRRQSGAFAFLQVDKEVRQKFMDQLSAIIEGAEINLCCAIIDKKKLAEKYISPWSPYDLALTFCMERAAKFLVDQGETDTEINVIFEARGANEDGHLEIEFGRVANGRPKIGNRSQHVTDFRWRPMFADKRSNSTGLQIADMAARPLGLSDLRPDQQNRAVDILRKKMVFPHPKCFP